MNDFLGSLQNFVSETKRYPTLKRENEKLVQENTILRQQLCQVQVEKSANHSLDGLESYTCIPAQIINNTIICTKNYLTLNKGAMHGVASGMGVISAQGIVGRVKAVSDRFATVVSLLHTSMQVSAQIVNAKAFGTVQWFGDNPCRAKLLYIPRHIPVSLGDKVVTSGYNATFCKGVLIGQIKQAKLRKEASFYDIELCLSTDFSRLQHVYVVESTFKQEKDVLEQDTRALYE